MFAPTEDRGEKGMGFTHKIGDVVTISAPALGGDVCLSFGWYSQIATSSTCSSTVAIRPVRFGPWRPYVLTLRPGSGWPQCAQTSLSSSGMWEWSRKI